MTSVSDQLARYTHTRASDWFPLARARDGLRLVCDALAAERGPGEVVTQAFTCLSAVAPICAAGHTPVYGDLDPQTYALDPTRVPLSERTRAVVAQHTFGMVGSETEELARLARERGAIVVEDSAHCVARLARCAGRPVADVSVHSFGAEKILPTSFGGALWVNPDMEDQRLRHTIIAHARALEALSVRERGAAATYRWQMRAYTHTPVLGERARGLAQRLGVFWPPVTEAEIAGEVARPRSPSPLMLRRAEAGLARLEENMAARRRLAKIYVDILSGVVEIPALAREIQPLARFPLTIPTTSGLSGEDVFRTLTAEGYFIGKWYRPSLFPGVEDPARYNLDPTLASLPTTRRLTLQAVNLLLTVTPDEARETAGAIRALIEQQH